MKIDRVGRFLRIIPTIEQIEKAKRDKIELYGCENTLNTKTFDTKDKTFSTLSENLFGDLYSDAEHAKGNRNYDYIYRDLNLTIDIKTKVRNVVPRPEYNGGVPKYQIESQKTDWYCFCSVNLIMGIPHVWFCGKIKKSDFCSLARVWEEGETDSSNGLTFKGDSYALHYSKMEPLKYDI